MKNDLFISTDTEKKNNIKKILLNSTINKYEIKIYKIKGRDIYPFLRQMAKPYKKYKYNIPLNYICHLNTKKMFHNELLGLNWSKYLYSNLIGNKGVII